MTPEERERLEDVAGVETIKVTVTKRIARKLEREAARYRCDMCIGFIRRDCTIMRKCVKTGRTRP